jgi:hypothetical protein
LGKTRKSKKKGSEIKTYTWVAIGEFQLTAAVHQESEGVGHSFFLRRRSEKVAKLCT